MPSLGIDDETKIDTPNNEKEGHDLVKFTEVSP